MSATRCRTSRSFSASLARTELCRSVATLCRSVALAPRYWRGWPSLRPRVDSRKILRLGRMRTRQARLRPEGAGPPVRLPGREEVDEPRIEIPQGSAGEGGSDGATVDVTVVNDCARTEVTAVDTTIAVPADIIVLVDNSPSMVEEIGFVRENLNAFAKQIVDNGVDARLIMIAEPKPEELPEGTRDTGVCIAPPLGSGSCPDDTLLPNYVHIPQAVASTDSLDVLMRIQDEWLEYMRPEAVTAIFIVSDSDGLYPMSLIYGDPPLWEDVDFMSNTFFESFEHFDLHPWSLNAVYPFSECEYAERRGQVYERLVEMTGGIAGDLCEQDFQPVFDRLAARVVDDAVTLSCEWEIPESVEGQTFSTELVKVTRSSAGSAGQDLFQVSTSADCVLGAWHFDDPANPKRILACPETCEAINDDPAGKIDVVFGCEIVEGCSIAGSSSLIEVQPPDEDAGSREPVACQWPVPEAEPGSTVDFESLNVRYVTRNGFGILLGQVQSACASLDQAWYYDDPQDPTSIVACPSTCETLQGVDVSQAEALFGCETKIADIK